MAKNKTVETESSVADFIFNNFEGLPIFTFIVV
jgi:hypothetical protein